jgi:transposase-like protein
MPVVSLIEVAIRGAPPPLGYICTSRFMGLYAPHASGPAAPGGQAASAVLRRWRGVSGSGRLRRCRSAPTVPSSDLTRDGHNQRGRVVRACRTSGRHATSESTRVMAGHRFPRDIILLSVRYYLQLGAAPEHIAGMLADRGIDVSGQTILRWVQKFGPALSEKIRRYRKPVSTTWLLNETYVKILGRWHYLYRGVDPDGQVLDCWLLRTPDLVAAVAFFRRAISSTGCLPEHVVTDKACVLSVGYPYLRARCQAHRHRLLQPGDLDQSLRAQSWLREVSDPSHARTEEFHVRHAAVPSLGRGAVGRARLRTGAADRGAIHRRTQLCPRAPRRRSHHSTRADLARLHKERRTPDQTAVGASGPHANVGEPVGPAANEQVLSRR